MKRKLVVAGIALTVLTLSGCKQGPEPSTETAAPAVATPEPAPTVDPALAAAATPSDFDMRSFAGSFSGTLPCADCPGTDTRIELAGDGNYLLEETYQGKQGGNVKGDGTWTAEEGGTRLRLDPNNKSADDRLFEIVNDNEIRLLGKDGKAIASQSDYRLKRIPAR
jgi:copper homeostasis protein (lipoprotein)